MAENVNMAVTVAGIVAVTVKVTYFNFDYVSVTLTAIVVVTVSVAYLNFGCFP